MKKIVLLATICLAANSSSLSSCPIIDCNDADGLLEGSCFLAVTNDTQSTDKGKLSKFIFGKCESEDHEQQLCYIPKDKHVWLDTQLQMMTVTKDTTKAQSQFYGKITEAKCQNTSDTISTRLHSGRQCLGATYCNNRVCPISTRTCQGAPIGEACNNHIMCDSDLACRIQSVWPYATTCQPRGDVNALCMTDYDCKARNFCWKITPDGKSMCMGMFTAPFGTKFLWDNVRFPVVNKTSVLFHGKYCQSGYATKNSATVAECVIINSIAANTSSSVALPNPYACKPDGQTQCQYKLVNNTIAFSLTCECAMMQDDKKVDLGFCPIPDQSYMMQYVAAMKKVWYQDNCHTLDRENLSACLDCGIGSYDKSLKTAIDLAFTVKYYPQVQDAAQKKCLVNILPEGVRSIFAAKELFKEE